MSIEALGWAIKQNCSTPSTKLVLFVMANYADEQHSCYPSEKHLAKICGITDRSVRRCITSLKDSNLLSITHRKGTSNRYFLTVDIAVRTRVDMGVRTLRTRVSANTKDIQKNKPRSKNELAG